MPARDPTASPHISSTTGPPSRRTSIQHVGPIKDLNDPANPHRPTSPSSSGISGNHHPHHNSLSKSVGAPRIRRESMTGGMTSNSKGKRRGAWYGLGGDDSDRAGESGVTFDANGDAEDAASPPSQNSLTAAAIRDRTLNLAASLASQSYGSSGFDEPSSSSHRRDDHEESVGRPFGGTRLSRILDSSLDLTNTGSKDQVSPTKDLYAKETLNAGTSPDGRLGSPASGPSALSLMLSRSTSLRTSPNPSAESSPKKHAGSTGLPKDDRDALRSGGSTDIQASGANGLIGLLDTDTAVKRSRHDKEEVSPGSSLGQETPRPGAYRALASLSSSSQTIRPSGPVGRATTPTADEDVVVERNAKVSETTPLLHTIRETGQSGSRSRSPPVRSMGSVDSTDKIGGTQARPTHSSTDDGKDLADADGSGPPDFQPGRVKGLVRTINSSAREAVNVVRKSTWKDVGRAVVLEPLSNIPAVILGLMLNVLDGVSYGMITFPASPVFTDFGSIGVSMFFMSCIISQLSYTLGGSIFRGGNGSMMIEAVPFFHILTNIITTEIGDNDRAIIATTMVSFAFSAVLTGLVFFALGAFKLGALIGYFPRHILVGCIGGVGIFLLETGLEVSRGLKEEGFEYNLTTLKFFFESPHAIALWGIPLALAIILRIITHRFHHQLIFPAYFFIIPVVFYIVVAIGGWDMATLRENNWVLDVGKQSRPWYTFYTLFDFKQTNWKAFWACIPTQLALVFFGILHVPLNVPALGVSLKEDHVKLDRELLAHGVSNMAAGFLGTVPNYLCYVNTVLFYRVGGGSRLSGLMLAGATTLIMTVGPSVIGYLPVCVVGALIFVLGIDLVTEAIWDTRNRVNRMEYITVWAIAIGMTIFDFVLGLLLGIVLASLFFVIQNSRRRPIRAVFSGATAKSTVRRPHAQRQFIQQVGSQTCVMKLQGFLFFGTITRVEDEIRRLLDIAAWQHNPIRFLIVDFALVGGLDYSSAEAFVRIQRLLSQKDVLLILCGASPDGLVGQALQAVDLWADQEGTRIEVFDGLNSALEWCENAYLQVDRLRATRECLLIFSIGWLNRTAFYQSSAFKKEPTRQIDFPTVSKPPFALSDSYSHSPRRSHLAEAGGSTRPFQSTPVTPAEDKDKPAGPARIAFKQPLPLLMQTFAGYHTRDNPHDFFYQVMPYFTHVTVSAGDIIWTQGDMADALYLIESGCLRATYTYEDHTEPLQETMVAGTVAGEMTALSGTHRNATAVAERDAQLWRLSTESLERLQREKPDVAKDFIKLILKVAAEEADVLSSHLIAVLS